MARDSEVIEEAGEPPVNPTEWLQQFIEVSTKGNLFGQIIADDSTSEVEDP